MFDWNKPFRTREGWPAVLKHVLDPPWDGGETHIVYVDAQTSGYDLYFANGKFMSDGRESKYDLVNIPEKKVVERWVVVGSHGESSTYQLEAYAQKNMHDWRQMGHEARIHHIREEF